MTNEKNSSHNVSGAIPSMAALLAFEAAARCGSFADAAKQLGRTPSAVSHAIRDLEDRVGETLFERRGRSVTLTEAGAAYLQSVEDALATIRVATRRLRRHRDDHVIRLSALPFFTSAVLLPNLSRFEADNPQLELRIETSTAYADILSGDADIGIRFGSAQSEDLVCAPLIKIAGLPIASPAYLNDASRLESVSDLHEHTLLHVRPNLRSWSDWAAAQGIRDLEGRRRLTFDTILGVLDAVKAGTGVALAMDPLIRSYPGFGSEFMPVLPPAQTGGAGYNFICRRSNFNDRKIQRTLEWLQTALSDYEGLTD